MTKKNDKKCMRKWTYSFSRLKMELSQERHGKNSSNCGLNRPKQFWNLLENWWAVPLRSTRQKLNPCWKIQSLQAFKHLPSFTSTSVPRRYSSVQNSIARERSPGMDACIPILILLQKQIKETIPGESIWCLNSTCGSVSCFVSCWWRCYVILKHPVS